MVTVRILQVVTVTILLLLIFQGLHHILVQQPFLLILRFQLVDFLLLVHLRVLIRLRLFGELVIGQRNVFSDPILIHHGDVVFGLQEDRFAILVERNLQFFAFHGGLRGGSGQQEFGSSLPQVPEQ